MVENNPWKNLADGVDEGTILEHTISGQHYRVVSRGLFDLHLVGTDNGNQKALDKRRFEDGPWQVE